MSQRNPMNDRYQTDERKGQTRKSAASMKPKTKPASSVRIQPTEKTKQQKKAERRAARTKQQQQQQKYYNPPTEQYKRLRKVWWGLLIMVVVCTAISFLGRAYISEVLAYVILGFAYVGIIGAFYIDFFKIRKLRQAYQDEMTSKKTKEMRAEEKQQRAAERAKKEDDTPEPDADEKKGGLLSNGVSFGGFRIPNFRKEKAEKQAAESGKQDSTQ